MNTAFFGSILGGLALAFSRILGLGFISKNLGISSLPVIPTAANVLPLTLRVAKPVIPEDTAGGSVDSLLGARDTDVNADAKVVIKFDADYKARVVVLPSTATDDNEVAVDGNGGDRVLTIVRDDPTAETSPHTVTPEAKADEDANDTAFSAAVAELMVAAKPARSLSQLINTIADTAKKLGVDLSGYTFRHTTVGDGELVVFKSAIGNLNLKVADVSQTDAPPSVAKPSRW